MLNKLEEKAIWFLYYKKCKELDFVFNDYEFIKKTDYVPNKNVDFKMLEEILNINEIIGEDK